MACLVEEILYMIFSPKLLHPTPLDWQNWDSAIGHKSVAHVCQIRCQLEESEYKIQGGPTFLVSLVLILAPPCLSPLSEYMYSMLRFHWILVLENRMTVDIACSRGT